MAKDSIGEMQTAYEHMLTQFGPDFTWGFLRGLAKSCQEEYLEGDSDG